MNVRTLLFFLLIPLCLASQPFFDVVNIKYQYFPSQYFKNDTVEKKGKEINATLMIPFVQNDSNTILTGINYKRISSNDLVNSFSLYSFGVWVGYEYKWKNKRWSTTGFFIPKISADEFNLEGKNVQYGGVILFKFRKSAHLHYHAGLYYNRELFGNYFIPLIGLNWKASDKIYVYGNLPATINMEYKISPSLFTGLSYNSFTATYALHGDLKEFYLKEGDDPIGYAQLRLFLNWYFKKRFVLFFEPGVTYKRTYRLQTYSDEDVNTIPVESLSRTRNGFFLMAGVAYRFRFER